jgi:hypothetical protein
MKYSTVMPQVISSRFQLCFGDIGDEPMDLFCGQTQPLLGHVDSGLRNFENGDVFIAPCKEVINEGRFASTSVNDGSRISASCALYQSNRGFKVRTVCLDALQGPLKRA